MVAGFQAEAAIDVSGSFRNDLTVWRYEPADTSPAWRWGDQSILRLNFKEASSTVKLEGSFDLSLLAGDSAASYLATLPAGQDPSFVCFNTRWVPLFETRKLYISLFFERWTLTLGRQIINYGVGYVFSPVDCFSTVNLQDIGLSRKGSDILRVQVPLGDLAGIEGVSTLAGNGTDSAGAVKIFGNVGGYDLSLTGIYKKPQEELLVGVTFKGDLGLGIHGELVEHWNTLANSQYFEGMAGADYSWCDGKILFLAEYYYNGNPIDPAALTPTDLLALHRAFLGSSYLFGQVRLVYDEIRSFNVNGIHNLANGSWVGTFQFVDNIRQNTNLLLHVRYYSGDLNGLDSTYNPKAEYGVGLEVKF
jgi:hypothetical protein